MKKKVLIVVADYYKNISSGLINSAKKEIQNFFSIKVIRVPGVFEIPVMISKNIKKNMRIISITGGIILFLTGILILTNSLQIVGFYLLEAFPFLEKFG